MVSYDLVICGLVTEAGSPFYCRLTSIFINFLKDI